MHNDFLFLGLGLGFGFLKIRMGGQLIWYILVCNES
jgi:hypothetical protein